MSRRKLSRRHGLEKTEEARLGGARGVTGQWDLTQGGADSVAGEGSSGRHVAEEARLGGTRGATGQRDLARGGADLVAGGGSCGGRAHAK